MPELRQEPLSGRWVIVAPEREQRPKELQSSLQQATSSNADTCPFCRGNEDQTKPATLALAEDGSISGANSGWQVRSVPNLYPAVVDGLPSDDNNAGATVQLQNCAAAFGQHEVLIESPLHIQSPTVLSKAQFALVLQAYQMRLQYFRDQKRYPYAVAFKNCGHKAGASRWHAHSQIITLPFIPTAMQNELARTELFQKQSGQCISCQMIHKETQDASRVVSQTESFLAFCPFASCNAYETWVLPNQHACHFADLSGETLIELAGLMLDLLGRIEDVLQTPAYNYVLHTAPFDINRQDHYHWRIELIPRIGYTAGFEVGTGWRINSVAPKRAASDLRSIR